MLVTMCPYCKKFIGVKGNNKKAMINLNNRMAVHFMGNPKCVQKRKELPVMSDILGL